MTAPVSVFINDEKATLQLDSLNIDKRIEERSVADFSVKDEAGSGSYVRGHPVAIVKGDTSAAWLAGWKQRTRIVIDNTKVDSTLTWFPVMLRISGTCGLTSADFTRVFDELGSEKLKIAVTKSDGQTQLYVEIEKWDADNEEAILWVSRDGWEISSSSDTVFYLYYDADHADNSNYVGDTNSTPAENVWDAHFINVCHMSNGVDNQHCYDSTNNNDDWTKGGAAAPTEAAGKVGKCQNFNRAANEVLSATGTKIRALAGDCTVEALFRLDNLNEQVIFATDASEAGHLLVQTRPSVSGMRTVYNPIDGYYIKDVATVPPMATGVWHLTTLRGTATSVEQFSNGASTGIDTSKSASGRDTDFCKMGERGAGVASLGGDICEARVSDSARSDAWIKATFHILWDELLTIPGTDETLEFAGFIDNPGKARLAPVSGLLHDITCMDNHYLADKRLVVKSYTDKTLEYIVEDILTDYLADEGVTEGLIETGPTIAEAIFNYVHPSDAFDSLKELSGKIWFLDECKRLYFVARETYKAPWQLDNSTYKPIGKPHLSTGNPLYRNKQYVRGGTGITSQQTENFTGDGDTKSFTLGYPLAQEPTITEDAAPKTVGIKGIDTGKDYYWNKGDNTVTADTAPANAVAVQVVYYGQYPLIALASDSEAQVARAALEGGTGIVEEIVTESRHESSEGIQESASGKLKQYCRNAEKFIYRTMESGLAPGQLQEITNTEFGFSAHEMLIESVGITTAGDYVLYDITCITGPSMGSWAKFFTNIITRQDKSIRIGDSLLLVLLQQEETLELTEETAIYADDFSGGQVNRWLNAPPITAGSLVNIEHERLELTEMPSLTEHLTEDYDWDDEDMLWDFFTYG